MLQKPFYILQNSMLVIAVLLFSSCKKNHAAVAEALPSLTQTTADKEKADEIETQKPEEKKTESKENKTVALRFMAYNLKNWLTMESRFDFETKKTLKNAPKPQKEKDAVIKIITSAKPDVLGVCEIGTKEDLLEVQSLLKASGLDLPHLHYSGGLDNVRHLGFLSKFPITSTVTDMDIAYQIQGKDFKVQRGILDATIQTPDNREWRFLGLHLKSKRDVEEADQEVMRQAEAGKVRAHIEKILTEKPNARLICYGDLNSTRREPATKIVQGKFEKPDTMRPIGLHDSREMYWTHFWEQEDIYSRFDYILTSPALRDAVIYKECGIIDPPYWNDASDHRAVMAAFE